MKLLQQLGLGGAQGYYQVTPDFTTLGKIVGGGMPLAAYGGKREIMDIAKRLKLALEQKLEQSITVNQIGSLLSFFFHHSSSKL